MKKLKITLLLFCLFGLLSGCVKRYEDTVPDTQRGYNIYRACQNYSIFYLKNKVDLFFKFNAWYTAGAQTRKTIKAKWFPQYDIVEKEPGLFNFYDVMNRYEFVFSIHTHKKKLTEEDAHWTMGWWSGEDTPENRAIFWPEEDVLMSSSFRGSGWLEMHIERAESEIAADLCWRVTLAESDSLHSFIDWRVDLQSAVMPQTLFESDFCVSGSGCYKYVENWYNASRGDYETYLKYEIQNPMCWYFATGNIDDLCWYGGAMDLEAFNSQGNTLPVKAEYVSPQNVKITYKGVSQVWNVQLGRVVE